MTSIARQPAMRAAILLSLTLFVATPALGGGFLDNSAPKDNEKPTWAVPAKRKVIEGNGEGAIIAELQNAEMRVREASQNVETAEWAYKRARTRRYPRGDALQEIKDRVGEMKKEKTEAEREFTALLQQARQSGIGVGTLAPYMDLADEISRQPAAQ